MEKARRAPQKKTTKPVIAPEPPPIAAKEVKLEEKPVIKVVVKPEVKPEELMHPNYLRRQARIQ